DPGPRTGAEKDGELLFGDVVLAHELAVLDHLPDLVEGVLLLRIEPGEARRARRQLERLGTEVATAAEALRRGEEVVGRSVDDRERDVAVAQDEVHDRLGLRRVARPGAGLGGGIGKGVRKVAI